MELIKKYYDCVADVTCPILIIQGKNDNLVPITSSRYVYDSVKSKMKKLIFVNDVTHDVFRGKNKLEINKLVEKFLKGKIMRGIENL